MVLAEMNSALVLLITLLVALLATTFIDCDEQVAIIASDPVKQNRLSNLTELFDFNRYKKLFQKHYGSLVEELARRTLFMARALNIIIHAIAFRFNKTTSYLALNDMSDWTQEERKATHLRDDWRGKILSKIKTNTSIEEAIPLKVNEQRLPEYELIKSNKPSLPAETINKVANFVPSNNPHYVGPDMKTFGLERILDPQPVDKKVTGELMRQLLVDSHQYIKLAEVSLKEASKSVRKEQDYVNGLDDRVFVDHRRENCFFLPRSQGRCGSCYIFNTISLIEWKYCRDTGKLVAFSEQYPMDCGQQNNLKGCGGGRESDVIDFSEKYGLELRRNYPYVGHNEECPFPEPMRPAIVGYLRADHLDWDLVMAEEFDSVLRREPILVAVAVGEQFPDYGGGVDMGTDCQKSSMHSMLLVGSGREKGRDYWLFKNSYGVHFGDGGYYKLDKRSACMCEKVGIVLRGDFNSRHKSNINGHYDEKPLRTLFHKILKGGI